MAEIRLVPFEAIAEPFTAVFEVCSHLTETFGWLSTAEGKGRSVGPKKVAGLPGLGTTVIVTVPPGTSVQVPEAPTRY